MTERIREFLRNRTDDGPCLVVDLDVVRDNYTAFAKALPDTRVFYAVKANPAPEVLALLAKLGSCFDTASVAEIEMALAAGASPTASPTATPSRRSATSRAPIALGVRLYAVDCQAEVDKVARAAPGSKVFCRILSDCVGAEWPLSRKFGCEPAMAVDVLEHALRAGPRALRRVVPRRLPAAQPARLGPRARLGGGGVQGVRRARHQPADGQSRRRLPDQVPEERADGEDLRHRHLPARCASTSATASRRPSSSRAAAWSAMPASSRARSCSSPRRARRTTCAGSISTSASSAAWPRPWTRRSAIRCAPRATATRWRPCVLAGPTCDSADVLYEHEPYLLPVSLEIGDKVLIEGTGAYTATYSSVAFNGFPPLKTYHI